MVDFQKNDRIAELKKLIEDQQKKEQELEQKRKKVEEEQEELKKKESEIRNENKKIDELLEDALKEEKKDDEQEINTSPQRTDVQLQQPNLTDLAEEAPRNEEKEEVQEAIQESQATEERQLYRNTPQNPVVQELYRSLDTIYKSTDIPSSASQAMQQQRNVYRELRAAVDNMSQQQQEVAPGQLNRTEAYGQEVQTNPDSSSKHWQGLHQLARKLAERAGPDEHNYQERIDNLLNRASQLTQFRRNDEYKRFEE